MSRSTRFSELRGTAQPALVAERERIARELHKFTVYRLFGIGLTLQALSLKGGDPAVSVHLNECVHELDLAISELRGLVFKLDDRHVYRSARPKTPDSNPVPLFAKRDNSIRRAIAATGLADYGVLLSMSDDLGRSTGGLRLAPWPPPTSCPPDQESRNAHQQPSVFVQLDDVFDRQFAHSRRRLSPGQNV